MASITQLANARRVLAEGINQITNATTLGGIRIATKWYTVTLDGWSKQNKNDPNLIYFIDVSEPLFASVTKEQAQDLSILSGDFFVPVTKDDTWRIAKANNAFPLTRAVADQAHNQAIAKGTAVEFVGSAPLEDFEKFSKELCGKGSAPFGRDIYRKKRGLELVSGANKLWVLSAATSTASTRAINFGAYVNRPLTDFEKKHGAGPGGPYLASGWNVVQACHGAHNGQYSDYSQLLQLMKNLRSNQKGETPELVECLKDGDHRVWDEHPKLLDRNDLDGLI
jgi:hypothetical protein